MSAFSSYAQYYDLLNRTKNYEEEAEIIHRIISGGSKSAKTILDLGCGTGAHAVQLATLGYSLDGVDQSPDMLIQAANNKQRQTPEISERLTFHEGDVCNIRIGRLFDVVMSLFHVTSYQTTNSALSYFFNTARSHLAEGGIFIFDFWYGPTVLSQKPEVRVREIADDLIKVVRTSTPTLYPRTNIVDVRFDIKVLNIKQGDTTDIEEIHSMRYLFEPELENLLHQAGFKIDNMFEWETDKAPGTDTWSICCVARATTKE